MPSEQVLMDLWRVHTHIVLIVRATFHQLRPKIVVYWPFFIKRKLKQTFIGQGKNNHHLFVPVAYSNLIYAVWKVKVNPQYYQPNFFINAINIIYFYGLMLTELLFYYYSFLATFKNILLVGLLKMKFCYLVISPHPDLVSLCHLSTYIFRLIQSNWNPN